MTTVGKPEISERRTVDERLGEGEFDWTSHLTTQRHGPSTALCGKKILGIPADKDSKLCKKCIRVYEERYGTFFPWTIR